AQRTDRHAPSLRLLAGHPQPWVVDARGGAALVSAVAVARNAGIAPPSSLWRLRPWLPAPGRRGQFREACPFTFTSPPGRPIAALPLPPAGLPVGISLCSGCSECSGPIGLFIRGEWRMA